MSILPQKPTSEAPAVHSLWKPRLYPGTLATTAQVRADLRRDLTKLSELDPEQGESVVLCASEMFANACDHSRSGQEEGQVIRTLTITPSGRALRLSIIDDGYRDTGAPAGGANPLPQIPRQRTEQDWQQAERGRGLLLISHLATRWGTCRVVDFPFCEGLGTVLWADFDLPAIAVPEVAR